MGRAHTMKGVIASVSEQAQKRSHSSGHAQDMEGDNRPSHM